MVKKIRLIVSLVLINLSILFLVREIIYSYVLLQKGEIHETSTVLTFAIINTVIIIALLLFEKKIIKLKKQNRFETEYLLFSIMLFIVSMAVYFYEIMIFFLPIIARIKDVN